MSGRTIISIAVTVSFILICTCALENNFHRESESAYSQTALSRVNSWRQRLINSTKLYRKQFIVEINLSMCDERCSNMFEFYVTDDFYMTCRETCYEVWAKNIDGFLVR